jgi:hypothetical protein
MSSSRAAVLLGLLLFLSSPGPSLASSTERVSVSSVGEQGNAISYLGDISADGRFVAFASPASNLVSGDTNGAWDIFVHDRTTGRTKRVNVTSAGQQTVGNGSFDDVAISADGGFVAFESRATNLVAGDTNGVSDIFVHDRITGATERVNVSSTGEQGNDHSFAAGAISGDGRFVVFKSYSSNLVPWDTNGDTDVFVHDRVSGFTERVSVSSAGEEGNAVPFPFDIAISEDGRCVAFRSSASSLVSGDTNGSEDVFVHDCITGITERVSVSSTGEQGNGNSGEAVAMSGDGRFVAFESYASNLAPQDTNEIQDIFVHDRVTGATERVSVSSDGEQANALSGYYNIEISADGRFVAFDSLANNLVAGDTNSSWDVFVHDRATGATERVSVSSDGEEGDNQSMVAGISKDGRFISFNSVASDLITGDTNGVYDVFVRDRGWVGFPDVPVGSWAYDQIEACYSSDIVRGYSDYLYHPADPVTRDQMTVYIARAEGWINTDDPMDTAPELFPDVPAGFWAGTAIQACVDNNVVQGYEYPDPDTPGETFYLYAPTAIVTRDQMAVFIARSICDPTGDEGLVGYVPPSPGNFADVAESSWAYRHIEYCVEHGVVQGYDDGLYQPEVVVTRDQMAVYVARAFELPLQ